MYATKSEEYTIDLVTSKSVTECIASLRKLDNTWKFFSLDKTVVTSLRDNQIRIAQRRNRDIADVAVLTLEADGHGTRVTGILKRNHSEVIAVMLYLMWMVLFVLGWGSGSVPFEQMVPVVIFAGFAVALTLSRIADYRRRRRAFRNKLIAAVTNQLSP